MQTISNRGGIATEIAARITDRLIATGEITYNKRAPISDRAKARMVQKLKSRGKWVSIQAPDRALITYMKDSRRPKRTCDECNGSGADGSRRNPEPCPVCNGKRHI